MRKTMLGTNKDIKHFREEFSLKNILQSIRKLKKQVNKLETQRMYNVPEVNTN